MSSASSPVFLCLTPVRDEAWILERFLACAATWADHIIVADQGSTDGSAEIAQAHPKVTYVRNPSREYDEGARQRLLIDAARRIPVGDRRRVLIALDADEVLSANWSESPEWERASAAAPGTVLQFHWMNVAPGCERGWPSEEPIPFGFVDDGSPHGGETIHSRRLPIPDGAPCETFEDLVVLHYQYADWERMRSKQRWYQCWERLRYPAKRPVTLYRQYHHMDAAVQTATPLRPDWVAAYERAGVDMRTFERAPYYRWDTELVALFAEHGVEPFRKLNVWDFDLATVAREVGRTADTLIDPRSRLDKAIHGWLGRTQPRAYHPPIRAAQQVLRLWGW